MASKFRQRNFSFQPGYAQTSMANDLVNVRLLTAALLEGLDPHGLHKLSISTYDNYCTYCYGMQRCNGCFLKPTSTSQAMSLVSIQLLGSNIQYDVVTNRPKAPMAAHCCPCVVKKDGSASARKSLERLYIYIYVPPPCLSANDHTMHMVHPISTTNGAIACSLRLICYLNTAHQDKLT